MDEMLIIIEALKGGGLATPIAATAGFVMVFRAVCPIQGCSLRPRRHLSRCDVEQHIFWSSSDVTVFVTIARNSW